MAPANWSTTSVTPDLAYLPKKYHEYIVPSVRRIYFDATRQSELLQQLVVAQSKIKKLEKSKDLLMKKCEQHMATAGAYQQMEQDARDVIESLRQELAEREEEYENDRLSDAEDIKRLRAERDVFRDKYNGLKVRYADLKEQNEYENQSLTD
ncbi:hypothetical protein H0H81_006547 [Sphagnurus paluster]|uniref:Uncharacterized protein n=1 Tax=Sphagnurus paluster TaxID=117069 RepID=A0A9P7KMU9_9AGAR|nr:hypothetical protein H0H81_006547 [Sphagnurus paluster]